MARVTVEDCIERVPNRFSLVLLAAHRARAISAGSAILVDRDNDKNPVVSLREIADDVVDAEELRETLIGTLQRVDERSEAEEEAETLALLADPTHMQMGELELVRALQSDRDGGQEALVGGAAQRLDLRDRLGAALGQRELPAATIGGIGGVGDQPAALPGSSRHRGW